MYIFSHFFSKSNSVMSNFAHNSENYLVFYWKSNYVLNIAMVTNSLLTLKCHWNEIFFCIFFIVLDVYKT